MNLRPSSLLLLVFHGRFWHQIKVTQRTHKFGVRLFSGVGHGVDRRVVAILGPRDGLGDVGVSMALGPFAIDVQFHLTSPLTVSSCAGCYLTQLNTEFKKHNKMVAMLPFGKCREISYHPTKRLAKRTGYTPLFFENIVTGKHRQMPVDFFLRVAQVLDLSEEEKNVLVRSCAFGGA